MTAAQDLDSSDMQEGDKNPFVRIGKCDENGALEQCSQCTIPNLIFLSACRPDGKRLERMVMK